MKLSVCIITYNHAPFIRQTIDSVLMQQTSFPFEIVIGEDDSNDGTRAIVQEYAARYPGCIRAFYRDRKDNILINGRPSGRRNLVQTIMAAQTEYFAVLEGDDYWTDPQKLQRQVDFLDANPQCTICYHETLCRNETSGEEWLSPPGERPDKISIGDILGGFFFRLCSVVIRRRPDFAFPDWYSTLPCGDIPLYCLYLSEKGSWAGRLPEAMACYRIHPGGIWTAGVTDVHSDRPEHRKLMISRYERVVETYTRLDAYFNYRHRRRVYPFLGYWAWELVWFHHQERNWRRMRACWWIAFRCKPFGEAKLAFIIKSFLVSHLPWLSRPRKAGAVASPPASSPRADAP